MSLWEYKIITSGRGGFASPALLEKFLNDLGREEWEIVQFHTQPDNFLVFTGLARRPTQRDWTLEGAAAAAAKAEADKLRAEFEAKFKAATASATPGEEPPASFLEEKVSPDDGLRKLIDTSHDDETDEEETKDDDDWDKLTAAEEDELPSFFDAIKPHMRRNQRGPGMSVGVDYLAKKWDQSEDDLKGALVECGFTIPTDEDADSEYLEFEGDLYWININRRGELWINTKEKPRPVFRAVKAQKAVIEPEAAPKQEGGRHNKHEPRGHKQPHPQQAQPGAEPATAGAPEAAGEAAPTATPAAAENAPAKTADTAPVGQALPAGPELLDKIRPMMRRNRRGPGGSGSTSFLSRALKCREADLVATFKAIGLSVPSSPNEKPTYVEIGNGIWWVNVDSRGNVWINGRDKKPGETLEAATAAAAEQAEQNATPSSETTAPAATDSGNETAKPSVAADVPAEAVPEGATAAAVPSPEVVPAATAESHASAAMGTETRESASVPATVPAAASPEREAALSALRPLLKETRTGGFSGKLDRLAKDLSRSTDDLVAQLVAAGLAVPEKPREKPVFVEYAGELFSLSRNARGELWLNSKAAKSADRKADDDTADGDAEAAGDTAEGDASGEKKTRRPRSRKKTE